MTTTSLLANPRSGARLFGARRSAWVEIVMFFALALVVDATVGDGRRFAHMAPHPFWTIVLLMSAFYGLGEGVMAALAASLVFRAGNLPVQQLDQQLYHHVWTVLREPLLWLSAAAVLGEIRRQHERRERELAIGVESSRARFDELAEAYRSLDHVKARLETRVAAQSTTAVQLFRAVHGADRLDAHGVLDTIEGVIRTALAPGAFSLFLLRGDRLELALKTGWPADARWPEHYGPDSAMFDALVAGRRVLCAAFAPDEASLSGDGLLAGPLVDMQTSQVIGILKVEDLKFLDFNLSSLNAFRGLCEWIATTYQNAVRFEEARAGRVADEATQLYSMTYLERQRTYLTAMAQRFGFDLAMAVLRIEDIESLTRDERASVAAAISRAVRTGLRRTDLAFEYRRETGEVAVLMPGTPISSVHVVGRKLERAIQLQLDRPIRFSMLTHVLHSSSGQSAQAESSLTFGTPLAVVDDDVA